jgi:inorganic triphosphatase YgiF
MPEIELKLAAAPTDLGVVRRRLLKLAGRQRAARARLTSVYYDTADRRLQRQGLSLRVRQRNRRYVQTVKRENPHPSPLLVRGEWEDPVADARPDLRAPNSAAHLPEELTEAELRPVFATIVRRDTIGLALDGVTRIEAAVDEGEIQTADSERSEPICEVELEHKFGNPAAIYEIGLSLLEVAPLRIEMRGKAERGFALLESGERDQTALHSPPVVLDPRMLVEAVLQEFGCASLAVVVANEPVALAGGAEGLHQIRVAIRRLRSVLNITKRMLPDDQYRWVGEELRWLLHALGPARNWDVFAESILATVTSALLGPEDRDGLGRAAEAERRRAHQAAAATIGSPRYTSTLLRLLRWFMAREWRAQPVSEQSALLMAPIGEAAPALIARRHKALAKALANFAELDAEGRHRVRIAVKKLRYTIDLLESLFPKDEVARFVRLLKPLQDELGRANDVRVAGELVAELRGSGDGAVIDRAAGIVLGWHDRGLVDDRRKLLKQVKNLRRARPFW